MHIPIIFKFHIDLLVFHFTAEQTETKKFNKLPAHLRTRHSSQAQAIMSPPPACSKAPDLLFSSPLSPRSPGLWLLHCDCAVNDPLIMGPRKSSGLRSSWSLPTLGIILISGNRHTLPPLAFDNLPLLTDLFLLCCLPDSYLFLYL